MRAGARIREGDLGDARGGRALVERAVGAEEAAVAVRGVLAEADVARDVEVGEELAEEADGGDDGPVGVVGGATALVLYMRARSAFARRARKGPRTLVQWMGTPKRMTLRKPFLTRGARKPSSLLTPHLH